MPEFFNEKEIEVLVLALAHARAAANKSFTQQEAEAVYSQARFIRAQNTLLDLALKGMVYVDLDTNGDLVWLTPATPETEGEE